MGSHVHKSDVCVGDGPQRQDMDLGIEFTQGFTTSGKNIFSQSCRTILHPWFGGPHAFLPPWNYVLSNFSVNISEIVFWASK